MGRKYEPIWNNIKKDGSCNVQVHKLISGRTVKAVIKEKNQDLAFKMANDRDKLFLSIRRIKLADNKHIRIEFKLKQTYGLVDVKQEIDL